MGRPLTHLEYRMSIAFVKRSCRSRSFPAAHNGSQALVPIGVARRFFGEPLSAG